MLRRTSSEADLDIGEALLAELRRSHQASPAYHSYSEDAVEVVPAAVILARPSSPIPEDKPPSWTPPVQSQALPLPPRDSARTSEAYWTAVTPRRATPRAPSTESDVFTALTRPVSTSAATPRLSMVSSSVPSVYHDAPTRSMESSQSMSVHDSNPFTAAAVAGTQSSAQPVTYGGHGPTDSTMDLSTTPFLTPFATPRPSRAPSVVDLTHQEKAPPTYESRTWDDEAMSQISEPISNWSLLRELEEQSSIGATERAFAPELPLSDQPPSLFRRPVMRKAATHTSERSRSSQVLPQRIASPALLSRSLMSSQVLHPFVSAPTSIASRPVSRYETASEGRTAPRSQASVYATAPMPSEPPSTSEARVASRSTTSTARRIKVPSLRPAKSITQASTGSHSSSRESATTTSEGSVSQLDLRDVIVSGNHPC